MTIIERINAMGKSAALLGAWTAIASIAAIVMNTSPAMDGDGYAICRVLIGAVGLVAVVLFWSGKHFGQPGMLAILAWGALQVPYYATAPDQNYTTQLFDLFAGASSSTTINGEIIEFSQVGFNLVGIAVVIWAGSARKRLNLWQRRTVSETVLAGS